MRNIKQIRVMISCPGNMGEEKEVVLEAIDEINRLIADRVGVSFFALDWERQTIGQLTDNAQDAVNEQLMKDYDILIAIIGSKLGTPTKTAVSGTAEEIEDAIEKTNSEFAKLRAQIFFSTKAKESIEEIDTEELKKVQDFMKDIKENKAFVRTFDSIDDFRTQLDRALNVICFEAAKIDIHGHDNDTSEKKGLENESDIVKVSKEDDENILNEGVIEYDAGYIESIACFEEYSELATSKMEEYNSYFTLLSEKTNEMSDSLPGCADARGAKKILDEYGDYTIDISKKMSKSLSETSEYYDKAFDCFDGAILTDEFFKEMDDDVEDIDDLKLKLQETLDLVLGLKAANLEALSSLTALPRTTAKFNKGKSLMTKVLNSSIEFTEKVAAKMEEYIDYLRV